MPKSHDKHRALVDSSRRCSLSIRCYETHTWLCLEQLCAPVRLSLKANEGILSTMTYNTWVQDPLFSYPAPSSDLWFIPGSEPKNSGWAQLTPPNRTVPTGLATLLRLIWSSSFPLPLASLSCSLSAQRRATCQDPTHCTLVISIKSVCLEGLDGTGGRAWQ